MKCINLITLGALLICCLSTVTAQLTAEEWKQINPKWPLLDQKNIENLVNYYLKHDIEVPVPKPSFLKRLLGKHHHHKNEGMEMDPVARVHAHCVQKLTKMHQEFSDRYFRHWYSEGAKASMPVQYYATVYLQYNRDINMEDPIWTALNAEVNFNPQTVLNLLEIPREIGLRISVKLISDRSFPYDNCLVWHPDLFRTILNDDRMHLSASDMKNVMWFWANNLPHLRVLAQHSQFDWEYAKSMAMKSPQVNQVLIEHGIDLRQQEMDRKNENRHKLIAHIDKQSAFMN